MKSNEIRNRYLKFFENRGHKIIPSASLVPENDPSVLFTTAGMHPLISYLMGQPHPMGKRLVNAQKCVRTGDIDDVGDNRHLTFFEMMGNWSLGDYFKKEAISWSFEFLTSKEEGLGLDPSRLYVSIFKGEGNIPRDEESTNVWIEIFKKNNLSHKVSVDDGNVLKEDDRIFPLGVDDNFWIAGPTGPCGGDTEMFYDTRPEEGPLKGSFKENVDSFRIIEVWNDVFMEFEKHADGSVTYLPNKNVDTGMGLERTTAVMQGKTNVFDTDLFSGILKKIEELSNLKYGDKSDDECLKLGDECWVDTRKQMRIVADHIRSAVFMTSDGVVPANNERGYVLRRILRRAIRYSDLLKIPKDSLSEIAEIVIEEYKDAYTELDTNKNLIKNEIEKEENKFRETLAHGLKEFERGVDPFILFTTYGFPLELTQELAKEKGEKIDVEDFNNKMAEHQKLSQISSAGMFKGGLANHNEKTIRLHTAHHLLLAGLQNIVNKNIKQRGSNITEERLRIDFLCDHKLTDEEKKKVEDFVNEKIKEGLNVIRKEMPLSEAEKVGAEMEFGAKYPEVVSVYFIEDKNGNAISKEFCGGPHVQNTSELGNFKIQKEEAVAAGIRRIKATLS